MMWRRILMLRTPPALYLARHCSTSTGTPVDVDAPTTEGTTDAPVGPAGEGSKVSPTEAVEHNFENVEQLSVAEICETLRTAAVKGASRRALGKPLTTLKTKLENGVAVKQLPVATACEALESLARANAFDEKDPTCNALLTHILNNMHGCHPHQPLKVLAALVTVHEETAKGLLEASIPLLAAKSDKINLRHAKLTIAVAIQLKMFDRMLFQAMESRITDELVTTIKSKYQYFETIQFFAKARFTPSTFFFESWDNLNRNARPEDMTKEHLLSTIHSLREMRRKPSTSYRIVDTLAESVRPFVKDLYITELTTLVCDLADLRYIQKDVTRGMVVIRERNENKVFDKDGLLVCLADRVIQLKDSVSIDQLKDISYGFAASNAHYFRLWLFISEKVKAVAGEIEPSVLVGIVKHMAKARFCDESLWKRIVPTLVKNKIPLMPPQAVGLWSDALRSTIVSRRSKTNDHGEAIKTSLVKDFEKVVNALVARMIEILNTIPRSAGKDETIGVAYQCLERTLDVFFPNEEYPLYSKLVEAKLAFIARRASSTTAAAGSASTPSGTASITSAVATARRNEKEKLDIGSADEMFAGSVKPTTPSASDSSSTADVTGSSDETEAKSVAEEAAA